MTSGLIRWIAYHIHLNPISRLGWFDLSVYYDLSSVQIHKALYKFLKSHWLHYEIDYVDIDTLLNNEQNGDTVWLHAFSGFTAVIALF